MSRYFSFLLPCALAIGALGAGPALAGPTINTVEIRVSSAGLDLNTRAGADQFLLRLWRAATAACGGLPDTSPLVKEPNRAFRLCRAKALTEALANSHSPWLTRQIAVTGERRDVSADGQ